MRFFYCVYALPDVNQHWGVLYKEPSTQITSYKENRMKEEKMHYEEK